MNRPGQIEQIDPVGDLISLEKAENLVLAEVKGINFQSFQFPRLASC